MTAKTYMQSAEALGTTIELRLVSTSKIKAEKYFTQIWSYVAEFEDRFSRFLKTSEVSKVNFSPNTKVAVSSEFIDLAKESLMLSGISRGLYNPFILPALQKVGYLKSMKRGEERPDAIDFTNRAVVNAEQLTLGADWVMVPENSALDFGGIGKGYLADKLTQLIGAKFVGHLFSIGGDISCAGLDENSQCWVIDVQSLQKKGVPSALYIPDSKEDHGIATSGLLHSRRDIDQPHVIDPLTGMPVDGSVAMCTVVSENATKADVLASCILIGGRDFATNMLESGHIDGALIQYKDGAIESVGDKFNVQ